MDWIKKKFNEQYALWMPWLEDIFLAYFTRDNKASYTTRQQLNKAKVTHTPEVSTLQDDAHNLAAGQIGQDGLLRPVGDIVSEEGLNRAERRGKDEKGGYLPAGVPTPDVSGLGGTRLTG
ncbi:hypothetical protein AAE478_004975 [Parahypoxylon ruwenzoriense]